MEDQSAIARDYRINRLIRAREVRLIGESGEQLGVVPFSEALALALEKDVDLVEVAATADPPVCRLLDYGKFRYEQSKKERESCKTHKNVGLREVRMRPRIDQHDIDFKSRTIKRFLSEGHKVKMSVLFRGREITHPELAMNLLRRVAESLQDEAKLEKAPSLEGRSMTMVLAPMAVKKPASAAGAEEKATEEKEQAGAKA